MNARTPFARRSESRKRPWDGAASEATSSREPVAPCRSAKTHRKAIRAIATFVGVGKLACQPRSSRLAATAATKLQPRGTVTEVNVRRFVYLITGLTCGSTSVLTLGGWSGEDSAATAGQAEQVQKVYSLRIKRSGTDWQSPPSCIDRHGQRESCKRPSSCTHPSSGLMTTRLVPRKTARPSARVCCGTKGRPVEGSTQESVRSLRAEAQRSLGQQPYRLQSPPSRP